MSIQELLNIKKQRVALILYCAAVLVSIIAVILASAVQKDYGRVIVNNVTYPNSNGILIRAKLLKPKAVSPSSPAPGVVYIHGYQNNRETSDAYCIEMARRGFVVLEIDAIGRGNSGNPGNMEDADFDSTYGGRSSLAYLKTLPYVNNESVGLMGHSLGAEMVYNIALTDPTVKALVISGFAYTSEVSQSSPQNMLMIFGKYDEYRDRMTGTRDIEAEWMSSPQTLAAFGDIVPEFGVTYGDFAKGTARKVVLLPVIHIQESHNKHGIAEAVRWMRSALSPDDTFWIDADKQIWEVKEYATLIAMVAGFNSVIPLGFILIRLPYFKNLHAQIAGIYSCSIHEFWIRAGINGLLMWLYLPLVLTIFAIHMFVVPIDKIFPMMLVNGTVWWFVWINVLGFVILRHWLKKHGDGVSWEDLGISFTNSHFLIDWVIIGKTALLALMLFTYIYLFEAILERIFIVDYRFLFPFASDLTPYRFGMWLLYFPFFLIGFILMGFFLHGQIRLQPKASWWRTFISWSIYNTLAMVLPLILFLMIQYVPLLTVGFIPFVGPGGMLASYTMNLFHIIGVLLMITPISTWFYQLTGHPYLGAIFNAALVTWMFVSSQVIAPIPV